MTASATYATGGWGTRAMAAIGTPQNASATDWLARRLAGRTGAGGGGRGGWGEGGPPKTGGGRDGGAGGWAGGRGNRATPPPMSPPMPMAAFMVPTPASPRPRSSTEATTTNALRRPRVI